MTLVPLSVAASKLVPARPARVYPFLADPEQRTTWMTELRRVEAKPGMVEPGDRFVGLTSILFHDFIGTSEVTEVEPEVLLTEEVVIGARFVSRWRLTEVEGGTRVHHSIDVDFPGGPFSRLERWVLGRRLLRVQRQSLANLTARLSDPTD